MDSHVDRQHVRRLHDNVFRRRRELGIRSTLGASRASLITLVIGQGMSMTAIGLLLGLGGSVIVARLFRSLLFGVNSIDPIALIAAPCLMAVVALAACLIPAWRASSVPAAEALRSE
jgi:ABC-type antimicrobial peptide transport system permease subunit